MFSQIELMLFVIFAARSRQATTDSEASADGAIAAFAFFLFIIYFVFSLFLFFWRSYLPEVSGGSGQSTTDSYA